MKSSQSTALVALTALLLLAGTPTLAQKFEASPVETHLIEAEAVDQTYRIQVSLPLRKPGDEKRYPVLYMTDMSSEIGGIADLVHLLGFAGEMSPVIVVGIGYPVDTIVQTLSVRTRDLTPVDDPLLASQMLYLDYVEGVIVPEKKAGGAAEFLTFLHAELIPFIEENYPASSDRAYFGDSLGGLFGLYVLLERPETFSRYIIGSPSTWVGEEWIMKRAEEFVKERSDLPARVFMAAGGKEELPPAAQFRMITNIGRLESLFAQRDFPSLRLVTHVFPDETHQTVVTMNLMRGLAKVFDPEPNELMVEVMKAMGMETPGDG